jgi:hypothetical protein
MPYQAPTLKVKYMKPDYLNLANKRFISASQEFSVKAEAVVVVTAATGGIAASVTSGKELGTTAGNVYVKMCGSRTF